MSDAAQSELSDPDGAVASPGPGGDRAVIAYLAVAAAVLLLMMMAGLAMRLYQIGAIRLPDGLFYQLLTAHGAGMVGIAALGGAAIMWAFLRAHVRLHVWVFVLNLVLFLAGVALMLTAIFWGRFAAAWTFLYPLPAVSGGAWEATAAALHLTGLLVIGIGFLLLHLDMASGIRGRFGRLRDGLGWPELGGAALGVEPPPTVVAATMVLIVNTLGILVGAGALVLSLLTVMEPDRQYDALLAKNMIFFFGHIFINAAIYMAVAAVYEILPVYCSRPWPVTRTFLAAWNASLVLVLLASPHHLMMDFAMPAWAMAMAQIVSHLSGMPILLVTAWGTLTLVHRSGMRWDMASGFLFLGVMGWAAGVVPAIVGATVVVNAVLHNTLWVPGHFHTYLLVGLVPMMFGCMYFLRTAAAGAKDGRIDRICFWMFVVGATGFAVGYLFTGADGAPRRYPIHLPEWTAGGAESAILAAMAVLAVTIFVLRFLLRVPRILKGG